MKPDIPRLTTLCYIEKDGCYLILHRTKKQHDENGDKWIGVGGKFEYGESPEECALREVKEETGLTMLDPRFRGREGSCQTRDVVSLHSQFDYQG